jgi:Cu+-exporting ATPase
VTVAQRELVLDIDGMTCASCVQKVERALDHVDGVDAAAVNLATRTATVRGELAGVEPLIGAVEHAGYGARAHDGARDPAEEERGFARRLALALPLTVAVLVVTFVFAGRSWSPLVAALLATPVVAWAGWPFFRNAARAARHATTTMDTLVALGAAAAYLSSVWQVLAARAAGVEPALYFDTAAVIVTLILLGKYLEARARSTAGDASRALLARAASEATIVTDEGERAIDIAELLPGMVVIVRPGEKVPADGVVRAGSSWVDLSLLTGESVPIDVAPGDEVVGASINGHGRLEVFVTKVGANAKLGEIVRLLQTAQGSKAEIQRVADRVSSVFVPFVLALAAATFAGWMLVVDASAGQALLHATTVVLIACPCALGLATPVAIVAGAGRAAELGVLFKGGMALEATRDIDTVLVDKTGTITRGVMTVAEVRGVNGVPPDEVLALGAAVEAGSEHPIARAVTTAAAERGLPVPAADGHRVEPGTGASALVAGVRVDVRRPDGLPAAMASIVASMEVDGGSVFAVWRDRIPVGVIAVTDEVRPDAQRAVERLRSFGVTVAMVTGDQPATARAIGNLVGIDTVLAGVGPDGKIAEVRRLGDQGRRVAFVGDGLNDAPALAAARVGMAVGSGTDVALAASDVNLLGPALTGAATALEVARRTACIIRQNLFWAFAYNIVMIPLAVVGALDPMWAAGAMAASSVTVVLNALRLRRIASRESP